MTFPYDISCFCCIIFLWDFLIRVHAFCCTINLLMRFHAFEALRDFLMRFHGFWPQWEISCSWLHNYFVRLPYEISCFFAVVRLSFEISGFFNYLMRFQALWALWECMRFPYDLSCVLTHYEICGCLLHNICDGICREGAIVVDCEWS